MREHHNLSNRLSWSDITYHIDRGLVRELFWKCMDNSSISPRFLSYILLFSPICWLFTLLFMPYWFRSIYRSKLPHQHQGGIEHKPFEEGVGGGDFTGIISFFLLTERVPCGLRSRSSALFMRINTVNALKPYKFRRYDKLSICQLVHVGPNPTLDFIMLHICLLNDVAVFFLYTNLSL